MKSFIYLFFLLSLSLHAQTYRDTLVSKIVHYHVAESKDYAELKAYLLELEVLEKVKNPELLYRNLERMFQYEDRTFFKETLTVLTEKYGFNVSYLTGKENYYAAIFQGDLAQWFKKMYLKNHVKWLEHNLDKLVDIHTLNSLGMRDQYGHKPLTEVLEHGNLSKEQRKFVLTLDAEYFARNGETLVEIATRIGTLPKGNSFALIQNDYYLVEWHNLQVNYAEFFPLIYPFYKSAYLNNNISSIYLRNIDSLRFFDTSKQVFGLLSIEELPEYLRENLKQDVIELHDPVQAQHYSAELKWE